MAGGTPVPSFTSITPMTAYYGPIAPPLDLSLFENGHSASDFLTPFLRLGKLSSNNDKGADRDHAEGDHMQLEHEDTYNELNYDFDHEEDHDDAHGHDDYISYHNTTQLDSQFDSDNSEDGSQSDHKMGILYMSFPLLLPSPLLSSPLLPSPLLLPLSLPLPSRIHSVTL